MAAVARGLWAVLEQLLGQLVAGGDPLRRDRGRGRGVLYAMLMLTMRVPEARQIQGLMMARLRSG